MLKVLSIGNSFSQDAHRYLHRIAKNEGVELKTVNLNMGGCDLQTHFMNMVQNKAAYLFEFNGESIGIFVSIADALKSDNWDVITLQQASRLSANYETYCPYITKLAEYVRLFCRDAKIMIHQTWAYEQGSNWLKERGGYLDQHDMFNDIEKAYQKSEKDISADRIIPCGKIVMQAIDNGIGQIHRDTSHIDLGVGRYLLGLVWFKVLTGETAKCKFNEFDVEVDEKQIDIAIETVKEVLGE